MEIIVARLWVVARSSVDVEDQNDQAPIATTATSAEPVKALRLAAYRGLT